MNNFSQNYTREQFQKHVLLVPLDFNFEFSSFQKKSAKEWRNDFYHTLLESSKINEPQRTKTQHLQNVENNVTNLFSLIRLNLCVAEPLLCFAYPLANRWIVIFFSDYFNKAKKLNFSSYILEVDYDPIQYAYKDMTHSSFQ